MIKLAENKKYWNEIEMIYYCSFPLEERYLPFKETVEGLKSVNGKVLAFEDNKELVGFIMILFHKETNYLYYFAINPKLQNKGYGSKILDYIKKYYNGKKISFSVEPEDKNAENYEQRIKRKKFYYRNGIKDTDTFIKYRGCHFQIMSSDGNMKKKTMEEILEQIDKMIESV